MTSYTQFFSGTATVAGALVGLLFVALSVAPQRFTGSGASLEHQAIASTAFTALVDALFVSLIGLEPGGGLFYGAISLGLVGLTSSAGLIVKLYRARNTAQLSRRWPFLLIFITLVYAAQVISGILLRSQTSEASVTVVFVYIMFGTGIARSWELIGLEGGGPLDLLSRSLGARTTAAPPESTAPAQPGAGGGPEEPGPDPASGPR